DSFMERATVALAPDVTDAPVAATTILEEPAHAPVAVTRLMDLSRATNPTRNLALGEKRRMGIAAIVATLILSLAGSAFYSLSHKDNAAIYSLAVMPFINVNTDSQLDYL